MVFSVSAFLGGVPFVASILFFFSPVELGFCIGSISVGYGVGSFLSARYSKHYELSTMIITGRVIACIGLATGLCFVLAGFVNV